MDVCVECIVYPTARLQPCQIELEWLRGTKIGKV